MVRVREFELVPISPGAFDFLRWPEGVSVNRHGGFGVKPFGAEREMLVSLRFRINPKVRCSVLSARSYASSSTVAEGHTSPMA